MKKIILYFISVVLVCSCTRYQSAINAKFPNTSHYTLFLKNTSSNNSIMYFYHLNKLVKVKKISKYMVKDSMNLKLVDIFFGSIFSAFGGVKSLGPPSGALMLAHPYINPIATIR